MNSSLQFRFLNHGCNVPNCPGYYRNQDDWEWYGALSSAPVKSDSMIPKSKKKNKKNKMYPSKKTMSTMNIGVWEFFTKALGRSSISGVNSIASSENPFMKIIWIFVLLSCLCGFCYQAFKFARIYNKRPSTVEIAVENDGIMEFPAVTLCNSNRIRKSEYCEHFPERCQGDIENLVVSEQDIAEIIQTLLEMNETEVRREIGHDARLVQSCVFNGFPMLNEKECLENLEYFYDPDYGNCYTISSTDQKGRVLEASEADFWQEANDMSVVADIEADELLEEKREPGVWITIHSGSTYPDIHTDGIMLGPGESYVLGIQKQTVEFLPLPYKTNCTDYYELPWKHGEKLPTSRMCTVGCSQHYQLEECGFVSKELSLFYEQLPWNPEDITNDTLECASRIENDTKAFCRSLCAVPCIDTVFEVTIGSTVLTEREISDYHLQGWENESWEKKKNHLVYFRVQYKTLEHTIFKHVPKYDTLELFSYLGGYSGVWLGFSLLTVYELVEIIFVTLRFAFSKYTRRLQRRKMIQALFGSKKVNRTTVRNYKKRYQARWH